ncbi:reverse transcriptase [Plakobranchus ocellatus]|uniref:Reverse transcriptase n=1 Tax=Plakobranchus ocellatus TaxID=259542 RepID=A0AAV4DUI3_9GAST|nr:reverse transcriptase [Plakobranchus ocellatus]
MLKNCLSTTTVENADHLNQAMKTAIDHCAPVRTRTISARPISPWFSLEIEEAKRLRRQAERKWRKTKLQVYRDIFTHHRDRVNSIVEEKKKTYYVNQLHGMTSCKELFQVTDYIFGNEKTTALPCTGSDKELCHQFSIFFYKKIENIRSQLGSEPPSQSYASVFSGHLLNTFSPVNECDVVKIITKSAPKSCDLDYIPTHILMSCIDILLPYITKIMNNSISNGTVLDCFKQAIVKPLLKKPSLDENDFKNYRPVSNLPFLSKILEKIVLQQLLGHIEKNGLHEIFQSAYKQQQSTETALLKVTSDILDSIDNRKICILSLLDLSSAFDTIDHFILLERLENTFGISGTALLWLRSYLEYRTQSVQINNDRSDITVLKYGVPQGSVLGPILFTLYTQPIVKILTSHNFNYHFYTDDLQIYIDGTIEDLPNFISNTQNCIEDIKTWMTNNKLKLNEEKTEIILLGHPRFANDFQNVTINLSGHAITCKQTVKNLEVNIDQSLSMMAFVGSLCKSLNFQLRRIGLVRHYLTENVTKTLVSSMILSKMDYCNSLLIGLPKESFNRLQVVQNNAARLVTMSKKRDHVTPVLKDLHWLPVQQRTVFKICVICYKCLNGMAPLHSQNLLQKYRPARSLRSSADTTILLKPSKNFKYYGERSFSYIGPSLWNTLPFEIRTAGSIDI